MCALNPCHRPAPDGRQGQRRAWSNGHSPDREVRIEIGCSDEMFDGGLMFADGSVYEAHVGEDL